MSNEQQTQQELQTHIDGILRRIRHTRSEWPQGMDELRSILQSALRAEAVEYLVNAAKRERLEFQWKLEELIDQVAPGAIEREDDAPPPEDDEEEEAAPKPDPNSGLHIPIRPEDLVPIYEDPRGIMIHRHKTDGRWVLTQVNPMTGQPQSMELQAEQKTQVQQELKGSPYWVEPQP